MFYGTYQAGGKTTYSDYANSNNYSIVLNGDVVEITFNQWTYYKPTVTVCPAVSTSNAPAMACSCWVSRSNTSDPWVASVRSYVLSDGTQTPANKNFSFHARAGMTRIFTAQTLTLEPEIIDFNGTKVLALSTTVGGQTIYLDKGTVLIGVGTSMRLELGQSSVSDNSRNTWNLTGWRYGDSGGPSGTAWQTDGGASNPYFLLETDPAGSGPATTPYSFAIKGIRSAGTGPQYICSDPVVRLSSVPPAGISL